MHRRQILKISLLVLCTLPALLFAYMGHFSRLMIDDYPHFATSLWLGFRDRFFHYWNGWHPSYTYVLSYDLLTPLGPENMPPLMPVIIIAVLFVGVAWIILHVLRVLQVARDKLMIASALAALVVVATIVSFHTRESIFWYSAAIRHTLPVGIFILYLGLTLEIAARPLRHAQLALAAVFGGLLCFVNAGMSELQAAIQIVFLLLLMAGFRVFFGNPLRSAKQVMFAVGWVGSVLSFLVQLSAPGSASRMAQMATLDFTNPVRDLPLLVVKTLESSYELLGHQGSILGFTLLMAAGLVATLLVYKPTMAPGIRRSMSVAAPPLLLGLLIQLCFVSALWSRGSEQVDVLGRFNYAFMAVLCLQIVLILAYLVLIWRRVQLQGWLQRRQNRTMLYSAAVLLVVLVHLATAQLTELHFSASVCLLVSALTLYSILCNQLGNLGVSISVDIDYLLRLTNSLAKLPSPMLWDARHRDGGRGLEKAKSTNLGTPGNLVADDRARQFWLAAVLSVILALVAVALPVAVGHYSVGYVFKRSLSAPAFFQVIVGLVWGAYLGFLIQRACLLTGASTSWIRWITIAGFVVATAIGIGIVLPQLSLIPDFATFAREWDARHEYIIRQRDSGEREIEVLPYSYDLTAYVSVEGLTTGTSPPYFYGVDSITLVDTG